MALFLPPAATIDKFTGGYSPDSVYSELPDTGTNDSQNIIYARTGSIEKRAGSEKIYNRALTSSTDTSTGRPITGHYWFDKLNQSSTFHVVASGDSLYMVTSATTTTLLTGLTDNSNTFFTFAQIQDPRSQSDDIMLASNGVDPIIFWNGSGSAAYLQSIAGATSVPKGKFLTVHKNRLYVANINSTTDTDAPVRVDVSGFGSDGLPDPHVFRDSFYIGGSNRGGEITGQMVLQDQVIYFTRNSTWKFYPGTGNSLDTSTLIQLQEAIGCVAPFSLAQNGNILIFMGEHGIYLFDGINFKDITAKQSNKILESSKKTQLRYSKGAYDRREDRYVVYRPSQTSDRNDEGYAYDFTLGIWQPVITGRRVSYLSNFDNVDSIQTLLYGDYAGYIYEDDKGLNDGLSSGFNGTATAGTSTTLTDGTASFPTSMDGLRGLLIRIYSGVGAGQERVIASNTATQITVETAWGVTPTTASLYTVSGIDSYWRSKDYDFGGHDISKVFRSSVIRTREEGNYNLNLHYIVDFRDLTRATLVTLALFQSSFVWGAGVWGTAIWGGAGAITRKANFRATPEQPNIGHHLALRFSNQRANERFKITGFDLTQKQIGKRD